MNWKYFEPKFEYEELFDDSGLHWTGHKFFAYDLISNLKPKRVVELGTYKGTSLFSFCQAAKDSKLDIELYAVDTWQGDKHVGFYGDSVWNEVNKIKNAFYPDLNLHLLRMSFDKAMNSFDNETIDILHIDGLHTYEAVKYDFESWLQKMKKNGMVLFHDIEVGESDFGVYKFWAELKKKYKTIEFFHSFGLGVLFLNKGLGQEMMDLQEELQMHYSYKHEMLKSAKIVQKSQEISNLNNLIYQKDSIIQQKNQEIKLLTSNRSQKLQKWKNKIKFVIFSPKKFLKKYLKW